MLEYMTRSKNLFIAVTIILIMSVIALGGSSAYGDEEPPVAPEDTMQQDEAKIKDQFEKKDYAPNQALVMFSSTEKLTGRSGKTRIQSLLKSDVSDIKVESLWMFKENGDLTTGKSGAKKLDRTVARTGYNGVVLVKSDRYSTEELVRMLKGKTLFGSKVKYVEPNWKIYARDAYSEFQWSMKDDGDTDRAGTELSTPNINSEWSKTTGSDNIVAILDTGVDYTHPDLQDNMWENDHYPELKGEFGYDFINGDADPMDDNGHGTHCAGIIGARGDEVGTSGVNKNIKIMALKILDDVGSAFMSHEIDAYNYIDIALDKGEPVRAINNSWGGGENSDIFAELIDIVGEKGAISVFSAGNSGSDNDIEEDYPSCIDSPYLISVAATDRDGELAEYSNYGQESVDVAAPGSEILSTVSYECYNPTIYGETKRNELSKEFNDFESAGGWGEQTIDPNPAGEGTVYLNGNLYDPDRDKPKITFGTTNEAFESEYGMNVSIEDMEDGDLICLSIPYEISLDAKTSPRISLMSSTSSSIPTFDGWDGSVLGITDMERGGAKDFNSLAEATIAGVYIDGKTKLWNHLELEIPVDDDLEALIRKAKKAGQTEPLQREIVILVYSTADCDYDIKIDDLGLSNEMVEDAEDFEKYDYMSGTSMSAPYMSGAIALKAAELDTDGEKVDPETLINSTISLAKADPQLPVNMRGALDFDKIPTSLPARIGTVKVSQNIAKPTDDKILIKGSGLDSVTKVEIGDDEDDLTDVTDKATLAPKEITVKDNNKDDKWTNNIKTIKLTSGDRESIRRNVYMVNGKKKFTRMKEAFELAPSGAMTTDGKNIYWTSASNFGIFSMPISSKYPNPAMMCEIDPNAIFKGVATRKNGDYGMLFGDDMVYINGKLYTVVEYGITQTPETEMEGIIIFSGGSGTSNEGFSFTEKTVSGEDGSTIYSGQMRLITTKKNEFEEFEAVSLGDLPADLKATIDWTMAAYNGKLYFVGGYSYKKGEKGITNKVWIYDPASKKWSKGPALCEPRAGGKAIQSGNNLVYTMGYSKAQEGVAPEDQEYPAPLIFDGKKWSKPTNETVSPHIINSVVTRGKHKYLASDGNIGLVKGGVAFMGDPVAEYGDTFTYDIAKKQYKDTGYNFINRIDSEEMEGIVVGGRMYGFEGANGYSIPVASGLINVTAEKMKNGSVSGTGSFMPGNTTNVTVKAKKNFRIKTLKVNGKTVKVGKATTKKVLTMSNLSADKKVSATFVKYKAKVKVKKKGKGKVTGGKTYVIGKKATIKVKAAKGYYIKSIKQGKKTIKVKKKATSKTFKFKVKKDVTVKVVFAKK